VYPRRLIAALLAALCASAVLAPLRPGNAQSARSISDPVATAIVTELDALMDPAVESGLGARLAFRDLVQDFYARRAFRPAWDDEKNAAELRRAIADSAADGLNPDDYLLAQLEELARQARGPAATPPLRARYDILLTESLLRLGYHLSFGKVDAETFDPQWNYGRTLDDRDVPGRIERALASQDIYQRIEALKPTHRLYAALKRELARYRAAEGEPAPPAVPPGPSLKPGAADPRVPLIRARLVASGDLAAGVEAAGDTYDPVLEAAVRGFQRRMGLDSDGVVGAGTVAELNVPAAERVRVLRVNLDRGRVLLHDLPERFVVVNIAGFTAYLVRGQDIEWSARVQVGKTYRKTPLFRSEMNYLVFNPTWTVPPGIIRNDILPAAKKDPASITRRGLKVLDRNGQEIDPASIDWSRFSSGIPYTLRQDPGPNNALGRVKLMFPNDYFVYLHDTPSQALFDKADRAFSSGCVRVERALELAERALDDPAQWNADSIAAVVRGGKLQNVTLKRRMPVLLAYWTAWVDPDGLVNFRRDLYGQDAKWAEGLDAPFSVRSRPLFSDAPAASP